VRPTLRKSLPLVLTLLSTTWGTARPASANQDPTSPSPTQSEGQVVPPKLKHAPIPLFSLEIRRHRIEGTANLRLSVAADGTLRHVEVIQGDPLPAAASLEAVSQWTFEPATLDGKPVEADTTAQLTFRSLDNSACHVPAVLISLPPNPVRVGARVIAPCLKSHVVPIYPPDARENHIHGTVRLYAIIATDGSVKQLEVEKGEPILAEAALQAVKQWTYEPFVLDGKPVEVDATVDVIFTIAE